MRPWNDDDGDAKEAEDMHADGNNPSETATKEPSPRKKGNRKRRNEAAGGSPERKHLDQKTAIEDIRVEPSEIREKDVGVEHEDIMLGE